MKIDLQKYWAPNKIHFSAHLTSRIIDSMQKDGWVKLVTKEPMDAHGMGLYNLLDQLCDYWKWDKSCFELYFYNDFDNHHDKYRVFPIRQFQNNYLSSLIKHDPKPWNHEKNYGMFLGRINVTRLRGMYRHITSPFAHTGLVSWHQDISEYIDPEFLLEYLVESDQKYSEISSIKPRSDIGQIMRPPITQMSDGGTDWTSVYERIGIELVFETVESSTNTSISEKIFRPMYFKRPFILIGGPGLIQRLKNNVLVELFQPYDCSLDFRFFENIIGQEFDLDIGIHRTDHAFDILETLIRSGRMENLHEECAEAIEINHTFVKKIASIQQTFLKENLIFDRDDWKPFTNLRDFPT